MMSLRPRPIADLLQRHAKSRLRPRDHSRSVTDAKRVEDPRSRGRRVAGPAAAVAVLAAASLYARRLREEKLSALAPAVASDGLVVDPTAPDGRGYDVRALTERLTRAGLVGSTKSVKDELHALRRWHAERGYHGGIVVRDLSRPLFRARPDADRGEADDGDGGSGEDEAVVDLDRANRRECYYLYYEIHPDGETRQQIFCRGTTLLADVITCLRAWFAYDDELGCRVHSGFNEHANRIVEDVTPLLVPPREDGHATVEVCGHSLGGAVATLVAIKLRKRGYAVTRVTSLAGPRICRGKEERDALRRCLPKETVRIEDDLDLVTYLPPTGASVGDKIWLTSRGAYLIPDHPSNDWTESVWLNLRLFESIWNQSVTHRVASYVSRLERLTKPVNDD